MSEAHLTDEARFAIRKYIVSLVAVPGFLITILVGMAGYQFKSTQEFAKISTVLQTKVEAQRVLNEIQRDISNLSSESRTALVLAQRDQQDIQAAFRRAKTTIESLEGVKDIGDVIERLEDNLDSNIEFQKTVSTLVRPSSIVMSEVIQSPGDCHRPRKIVVGNFPDSKFCALSQSLIYRHGQNKGEVYCQVALEQNNWVLIASGATQNCGSQGGANFAKCQAICWQ